MTAKQVAAIGATRIREGRERRALGYVLTTVSSTRPTLYRADMSEDGRQKHGINTRTFRADRRAAVSPRAAELAAEIERLRGMLAALDGENGELKGRVAGLEGRVEGMKEGRTILATYRAEEGSYDDV